MVDTVTDEKVVRLIADLAELINDLEHALARERGGGTPISTAEYLDLRDRSKKLNTLKYITHV